MRALLLSGILLSATVPAAEPAGTGTVTKKKAAPSVKKGLEAPSYLTPLARKLLKTRMQRHAVDTLALLQAVLLLDHATVQRLAAELAAEPRLTRPIAGGEDDLNAALPERFFVLQDELRARALELAEATKRPDNGQLSERMGELTRTCVSCHATYLEPRPTPAP